MKASFKQLALSAAMVAISSVAAAGILPGAHPNYPLVTDLNMTGGSTVDVIINIQGASAPDVALDTFVSTLAKAGTLTKFSDRSSTPGSSYTAWFMTIDHNVVNAINKDTAMAADKNVLIRKRSSGGSYFGTTPIANSDATATGSNAITQMALTDANCGTVASFGRQCSSAVTVAGAQVVGDMGTSDLPPSVFNSINLAAGQTGCGTSCTSNLNSDDTFALAIGVPVTNALYKRLQLAEGLNKDSNGDSIDDVDQSDATFNTPALQAAFIANMPSLSRAQLASLYAGFIPDFAAVNFGKDASGNALPLTDLSFGPALSDSRVFVCRRPAGSGTQAAINANILNAPCSTDADAPLGDNTPNVTSKGVGTSGATWAAPVAPAFPTGPVIHEASGSGDVDACLTSINGAGELGVGLLSVEKKSGSWAFIKIDGVAPTLQNMVSGKYANWGNESYQWRKTTNAPTGDTLNILKAIRAESASPATLNVANQSVQYKFGISGGASVNAALPVDASGFLLPFDITKPVMEYTRNGKTCNVDKPRDGVVAGVEFLAK